MNESLFFSFSDEERKVKLLSERKTKGNWTLSVEPMIPVFITISSTSPNWENTKGACFLISDGAIHNQNIQVTLGSNSGHDRSGSYTIIPTNTIINIDVSIISSNCTLYAFQ